MTSLCEDNLATMFADFRFAFRLLRKNPGFALVAILTLGLGLGATTLIFSLVNAVLVRPFPVHAPERLVVLSEYTIGRSYTPEEAVAYTNFVDWRRINQSLSAVALHRTIGYTLSDGGRAEHVDGAVVTAGFFELLGVTPEHGRTFRQEEESPEGPLSAVLSHALWSQRFGSSRDILGQSILLDGKPFTVVGVMPSGFRFPDNAAVWTAVRDAATETGRKVGAYHGLGRLKEDVTFEQAELDFDLVARRLSAEHPASFANYGIHVRSFKEQVIGNYRRIALTLFGAVACLLLITCVNLASLQLARAAGRRQESAVRAALGASRLVLLRQSLAESLVLGLVGGLLGLSLAYCGVRLLPHFLPAELPYWIRLSVDPLVLTVSLTVTVLSSIGFGLAPAWQSSRVDSQAALKQGGRSGSRASLRLMRGLVGAELALVFVLLAATGLFLKSFIRLQAVHPGFVSDRLLTFQLTLPAVSYPDGPRQIEVGERVLEKLKTIPGVESAALVSNLPFGGQNWGVGFTLSDRPEPPRGQNPICLNRVVSVDYFSTMGIPVRRGRSFTGADTVNGPRVAVIDETFAQQFFPDQNPIGKQVRYGRATGRQPLMEIVGVVGNVRHTNLQNTNPGPGLYVPSTQWPAEYGMFFALRVNGEPEAFMGSAKAALVAVDRGLAASQIRPMRVRVASSLWRDLLIERIFGAFAGMAVLLSALGVYGVTAYATQQRTREIGIRMALGAQRTEVLRQVLGEALRLAGFGLLAGTGAALWVTQLIATQLYEVSPYDPLVFIGVVGLIVVVALAATFIPARRASCLDPSHALRTE